ncbi:HIT family protein [Actinopolymorpha singaporensis]
MDAQNDVTGCLGCDLLAGRRELPGGVIHQTDHWVVNHVVGPLNLGTLVVAPRRHMVAVAELSVEAAEELGRVLRDASRMVEALCEPEQVYVCQWSHGEPARKHLHFVVQPVTTDVVRAFGGRRSEQLQAAMMVRDYEAPREQVEAFCERGRRWFRDDAG